MFRINRLNALTVICVALANASPAEAVQWPVNSGPIHQSVPQYRGRYPLHDLATPKSSPQPVLKFKHVDPTAPVVNKPIELVDPAPAQPNVVILPTLEPVATQPLLLSRPAEAADPPRTTSPIRHPAGDFSTVKPAPTEPAPKPKSISTAPKLPPKKANAKKTAAKKKAAKKKQPAPPAISYDIYRDRNPLPIDPRKRCGICTHPNSNGGCGCGRGCDVLGNKGRPYQEREPGGCRCGDKKCGKHSPAFSVYWPRPFSAKLDEHFPEQAEDRYRPYQKKRIVDVFDKLTDFKLIDYQRTDNGYCGEDSDPYGCLGESRMIASGVTSVGYRFPSVPVERSASSGAQWR